MVASVAPWSFLSTRNCRCLVVHSLIVTITLVTLMFTMGPVKVGVTLLEVARRVKFQ